MTKETINPGVAKKIDAASDHARSGACPHCGASVLTARPGRVAAIDVTADAEPISPLDEIHALLEGRLTWHLVTGAITPPRITWRGATHIQAGPARHPVLRDHRCPPDAAPDGRLF
ncbi:hypothetical protein [Streptomyces sp. RTd22]|uniref:hypothetical protein n=1 Tax=Streptomyces sp. RTd22 TaxID=1841249 RepID=UPI0007C44EA7|nr:hypothetical protein [Streptomyces sp. RTd22]